MDSRLQISTCLSAARACSLPVKCFMRNCVVFLCDSSCLWLKTAGNTEALRLILITSVQMLIEWVRTGVNTVKLNLFAVFSSDTSKDGDDYCLSADTAVLVCALQITSNLHSVEISNRQSCSSVG